MIQVLIRFLIGFITAVSGFLFVKEAVNLDERLSSLKNIILLIILSAVTPLIYRINYQAINPIISYFAAVLIYKQIFRYNYYQSIIVSAFLMLSIFIGELVLSICCLKLLSLSDVRSDYVMMIGFNLLSALIVILLSMNRRIKDTINKLAFKKKPKKIVQIALFMICTIVAISCLFLIIFNNYGFNLELIISIIAIIVFFILIYVYAKEQLEYNSLKIQMESLMKPVKQFEDWLEKESLNRHEYKNNLAVLRSMVTDKKAQKFIDDKLNNTLNIEFEYISLLKNVPTGGLKGLLFYKIMYAKEDNLNISFDVSKNVSSTIDKIGDKSFQDLCYLLGIFIDNAIEAASKSKGKNLLIEIYSTDSNLLNFVISNNYFGNVDINKVYTKGYTTKGKGRGNGLYFAKRISNNNPNISLSNEIINDYYIQKIKINIDN